MAFPPVPSWPGHFVSFLVLPFYFLLCRSNNSTQDFLFTYIDIAQSCNATSLHTGICMQSARAITSTVAICIPDESQSTVLYIHREMTILPQTSTD